MTLRRLVPALLLTACSGMEPIDDIAILPCATGVTSGTPCGANDNICQAMLGQGQIYQCVDGAWRCSNGTCFDFSVPVIPDLKGVD